MKAILALSIAVAFAAAPVAANSVQITGFGQMVAGTVTDGNTFPGTGYDGDWSFNEQSLFALQVRGDLNEQWSATAQLVARGREDFDPEFAWAYVSWRGDNGLSAKFGRQRLPLYRYSDFLEVGYAFPWVNVPHAVYNLEFNNFDGIGASYAFGTGSWFTTVSANYGRFEGDIALAGSRADAELSRLGGVAVETVYDDALTLRAGYFQADVTINSAALNPLLTGLSAAGFGNLASRIAFNGDKGTFWSAGAEYNANNWVAIAEIISVEAGDTFLADRSEYYVTGGYRFGKFLPTVTYGRRDNEAKFEIISALPAIPQLAPLRAGVAQTVALEDIDATYWSYGLRWDVANSVALKGEFTQYESKTPSSTDADAIALGVVFTF